MPRNFPPRNKQVALQQALSRFGRVMDKKFLAYEPVFILKEDTESVPGAVITAVLPLSGFLELFGDLLEIENFNFGSYMSRNKEEEFFIPDSVFEHWKRNGCLE